MNIIDIIIKKKNKEKLNAMEIQYVVSSYVSGSIEDYQMSALLMAICINGMDQEESEHLTKAMLESGDQLKLDFIEGIKVDKHSTGGVGDKTSLVVLPIVASCGVKCPKMSGRGLGFTGGTIDKLESIPGFTVNLTEQEMIDKTLQVGMCITSQTGNLAPADKKIYALRDVTGTVDSIPLIASSIMSKKLASGADAIILDVKVGQGALMKTYDASKQLAALMVHLGTQAHKKTIAILSNMNEPLGYAIGNTVEIEEVLKTLKGNGEPRFVELCLTIASYMIMTAQEISLQEARSKAEQALSTKKAYEKFLQFVKAQHGDITKLKASTKTQVLLASRTGYIKDIDAVYLANIALRLGSGRMTKEDIIDHSVGIVLKKKVGDYVTLGEPLLEIKHNKEANISNVEEAFSYSDQPITTAPIIYEIIE